MTNQNMKPTPGPWSFEDLPHRIIKGAYGEYVAEVITADAGTDDRDTSNAALIAEAGTVFHETGMTPRQLLEQRDELSRHLTLAIVWMRLACGKDENAQAQIEDFEKLIAKCETK